MTTHLHPHDRPPAGWQAFQYVLLAHLATKLPPTPVVFPVEHMHIEADHLRQLCGARVGSRWAMRLSTELGHGERVLLAGHLRAVHLRARQASHLLDVVKAAQPLPPEPAISLVRASVALTDEHRAQLWRMALAKPGDDLQPVPVSASVMLALLTEYRMQAVLDTGWQGSVADAYTSAMVIAISRSLVGADEVGGDGLTP